jgi:hypothetical protein
MIPAVCGIPDKDTLIACTDRRRVQGGQIMDNALCGGAGATLTGAALAAVKVAIFMGDPHNVAGLPYNVGTCTAGGVS